MGLLGTLLALSIGMNGLLWYQAQSHGALWNLPRVTWLGGDELHVQGTVVFSDRAKQPNPKKSASYLMFRVKREDCVGVDGMLWDGIITMAWQECTLRELDPASKVAVFRWQNCTFTVNGDQAVFACDDGDTGAIGDHLDLLHGR